MNEMVKYYRKKYFYRGSRDKYSIEQQAGSLDIPASSQAYATVVPSTAIQGMRKVKHLTVSVAAADDVLQTAYWALVYVPQGTTPNLLNTTGTTGMYEPNQFVMACGVVDYSAGPLRFHCPISRNLNSGDSIVLIMTNNKPSAHSLPYVVRYAISLQ